MIFRYVFPRRFQTCICSYKSGKLFIFTNTALFMDHGALPIFRELNSPQQSYHVSNRERPTHNIPINNPLWTHSNLRRNVYLDSGLFYIYQQYRKPILRPLQPTPSVSRYYSNIINTSIRMNRKLQYDSSNLKITHDRLTYSSLKLLIIVIKVSNHSCICGN